MVSKAAASKREAQTHEEGKRLRSNRRLLLIGTFIVLMTFVIKEVLRDQLKERSERISEAVAVAQGIDPSVSANGRILTLTSEMSQLAAELGEIKTNKKPSNGIVMVQLTNMTRRFVAAGDLIGAVWGVEDVLVRPPEKLRTQRVAIVGDYEALRKDITKLDNDTRKSEPLMWQDHANPVVGQIDILEYELKAADWELSVMELAKAQKKSLDDLYRWCTWGSYGLYVLGLVVGLIGSYRGTKSA